MPRFIVLFPLTSQAGIFYFLWNYAILISSFTIYETRVNFIEKDFSSDFSEYSLCLFNIFQNFKLHRVAMKTIRSQSVTSM